MQLPGLPELDEFTATGVTELIEAGFPPKAALKAFLRSQGVRKEPINSLPSSAAAPDESSSAQPYESYQPGEVVQTL